MAQSPNVLVIVLDCVRASDFPEGPTPVDGMPFLASQRKEFAAFPRAVSPAAWTLPSHVSLLSGMNLWEHTVHAKGNATMAAGLPGIAPMLHDQGYQSLLISCNAFLSPDWGFGEGFDSLSWGAGYGLYLRTRTGGRPPFSAGQGEKGKDALRWAHSRPWMSPVARFVPRALTRFPAAWDAGTRIVRGINGIDRGVPPHLGPWLEPTLERWLETRRPDKPVFCLVNLLDAHEPYLLAPGRPVSLFEWMRLARIRTDRPAWMYGTWKPSPREFQILYTLYRDAIRLLDARIARIVHAFQQQGRWDNTVCVITGDHGQAFGEHDYLYHGCRAYEPMVRIPLWVHWPNGEHGGTTAVGWSSLVDVAPTVAEAVREDPRRFSSGVPLGSLLGEERSGPVYTVGDGLHWTGWSKIPAYRKDALDQVEVVAFEGNSRFVLARDSHSVQQWELDDRGFERPGQEPTSLSEGSNVEGKLRDPLSRLTSGTYTPITKDLEVRLAGWGY